MENYVFQMHEALMQSPHILVHQIGHNQQRPVVFADARKKNITQAEALAVEQVLVHTGIINGVQRRKNGGIVDSQHRKDEEEKKEASPSAGGEKKRKATLTGEAEGSKKGKTLPPDYSTDADDSGEEWPLRAKLLAKS